MAEHTEFPSPDMGGLRSDDFEIHRQLEEGAEAQGYRCKDFCRMGCESCGGSALPSDAYYPPAQLLDVNRLVMAEENTSRHSGLRGKHQEAIIAAVRAVDIEETGRNPQREHTAIRCGKLYSSYSQYMQCWRVQQYSRCGDLAST